MGGRFHFHSIFRHDLFCIRRKNRRIGCAPNSVNLAMSNNTKDIQEQSNTTTRIQCNQITFSK